MSYLNPELIREELTNFLRSSDVIPTVYRGVTGGSFSFTAVGGELSIGLTAPLKNVTSYSRASIVQKYGVDYTINSDYSAIVLTRALTTGDYCYGYYAYGPTDKIYPDNPRDDLSIQSYPRISIEVTSINSAPLGIGGTSLLTDVLVTITAYMSANKDKNDQTAGTYGGTKDLNNMIYAIRNSIMQNNKNFGTFPYIHALGVSPLLKSKNDRIIQMSSDFAIKFIVEKP